MMFTEYSIEEISILKYGTMPKKEIIVSNGFPIYSGYRVTGYASKFLYEKPMVIIVARGVGGTGDVKISPACAWITNLSIIFDLDEEKVDKYYFAFMMGLESLKEKLNTGSAQAQITINALKPYKIKLPSLIYQQKIASILSAYDNLIENNNRRIAILEEMARSFYREWFVKFRFPGHEEVKMVDSELGQIPEGWEVKKLHEISYLTMGQSPKSEFYNEDQDGLPFFQGVADFGGRFPSNRIYCTKSTRFATKGDILFSVRAPVGRLNFAHEDLAIGRGLAAIKSKDENQNFLFLQLKTIFYKDDIMGNGSIFNSVTKDDVQKIKILVPNADIVKIFENNVRVISKMLDNLHTKNRNLKTQRDMLLPKLISGKLHV